MKKLLFLIAIVISSLLGSAQNNCQAFFSHDSLNPNFGMSFYDQSYNIDSSQINVLSWNWTFTHNGAVQTSTLQNPTNIQFSSSGTANVCLQITTSQGCSSNYCQTIVMGNSPCNLQVSGTTTENQGNCNGTITTNVTGGTAPYYYSWSNNAQTPNLTQLCSGQYTVIVTDQTPCSTSSTFYVSDSTNIPSCNAQFIYQSGANNSFYFFDESITSDSITGWNWMFGNGASATTQNPQVTLSGTGFVYVCLTITTSGGSSCTYCDSVNLSPNIPCDFSADINVTPVSTINGNDGAINLTVNGGTPPYTFIWSNNAQTEDIFGLTAGIYTVQIRDANPNCQGLFYTATIYSPMDSNNVIVDTLNCPVIDTCLNFTPNSFYISHVQITNNNTIIVTWVFVSNGMLQTLEVEYQFTQFGSQMIVLTLNCNGNKNLASYVSYINVNQSLLVNDNNQNKFKVYPNPTTNLFTIESKAPYTLQIMDVSGREIYLENVNESIQPVSLKNIPNGLYFISVIQGKTKTTQKLIITGN
jgi:hypothetical protein